MNVPKKFAVASLTSFCGLTLCAATYTWVPGSTNWRSPASYKDASGGTPGNLPGPGDTVEFAGDYTVKIGDDDFDFVSSLGFLSTRDATVVWEFDVTGERYLACKIKNAQNTRCGQLVKKGSGALQLGDVDLKGVSQSGGTSFDYNLNQIVIDEGALICPTNIPAYNHFIGGTMIVNEPGTLFLPSPGNFRFQNISGSGLVTNLVGRGVSQFQPEYGGGLTYSGVMNGDFSVSCSARLNLTSGQNTFPTFIARGRNEARTLGVIGLADIGMKNRPSSSGCNSQITIGGGKDSSGGILYLGNGETTDKDINCSSAGNVPPLLIDAGAHGGIRFEGAFKLAYSVMTPFILDGSNTVPCVIAGTTTPYGGNGCTISFVKQGTGAWRFVNNDNDMSGALVVENGTIQFDSIAKKGKKCALGLATSLYEPIFMNSPDPAHAVDYAYLLGADGSVGTLEYMGSAMGWAADRPIRLTGKGGRLSTDDGALKFWDVTTEGTDASTLHLAGAGTGENVVYDIRNEAGHGAVSVVKEGTGIWTLDGEQSFSGSLIVSNGTLVVNNQSGMPYKWFKFLCKETAKNCLRYSGVTMNSGNDMQFSDIFLYGSDNSKLLKGASRNENLYALQPGEVTFVRETSGTYVPGRNNDQSVQAAFCQSADWHTFSVGGVSVTKLNDPSSHVSVLMRLPQDAPEAVSLDYVPQGLNGGYANRSVTAYEVLGSRDGRTWDQLIVNDAVELPDTSVAISTVGNETAFTKRAVNGTINVLGNVKSIAVAKGATLRLEGAPISLAKLTLSADGNGTIENATIADAGTLTVDGLERGKETKLPVTFKDCDDVQNLANWTVRSGDTDMSAYKVQVGPNGDVSILPPGLMLIIR